MQQFIRCLQNERAGSTTPQHNDKEMIETIREVTDKPIRTDANQGWKDKQYALQMIERLATKNVEFIEQPMPKEMVEEQVWLKERSPMPIIGDEAVVRLTDMRKAWVCTTGSTSS